MTMSREQSKEYNKAYYQAHKEQSKAFHKAYYQAHKEEMKSYYQANKEKVKAYRQAHKEQLKANIKAWKTSNKDKVKAYNKSDVNSLGQMKQSIRMKSIYILKKMHVHLDGYEIHHCFGYEDPSKFIYISKELHLKIHQYLRDNNIDSDSDHYEYIKHLLDDSVVKYGI